MANATLRARLENQASAVEQAIRACDDGIADLLRALSAQLELTASSLEGLSQAHRHEAGTLAQRMTVAASIHEDGFEADLAAQVVALKRWLAEVSR